MSIPVFKPTIKRNDMGNVLTCMITDVIGQGPLSDEFAVTAAKYLELQGGIAVSNYYDALSIAIDQMELARDDHVICSSLAPILYLDVLKSKGLVPLIADVDPDSCALLPDQVKKYLDKNPKLILLHYTLGFVPDLEQILSFGIPVIEDLTQAFGASFMGKKCGNSGDFSIVGLSPDNIITTGGGALVLARDKKSQARLARAREALLKQFYMPDLNAALGIAQMKEVDGFLLNRREIASAYANAIMRSRHKTLMQKDEKGENVWFSFPVIIETGMKEARKYALKKDIETLPAFGNSIVTLMDADQSLPTAKSLMLRCLLFPCYPLIGKKNVESIAKVLTTLP
jgi:perosamine synthetase